jgi:hypothetical protein
MRFARTLTFFILTVFMIGLAILFFYLVKNVSLLGESCELGCDSFSALDIFTKNPFQTCLKVCMEDGAIVEETNGIVVAFALASYLGVLSFLIMALFFILDLFARPSSAAA